MSKLSQMFKATDASNTSQASKAPTVDSNPLLCKLQAQLERECGGDYDKVRAVMAQANASLKTNPR